ncbi:periplasmic chaperone for outer membrane proteins SurA [Bisgaardia hudsonensis]|uniref:Periplasmic chaperone for outer membrane proteins SurA n=1 Tax=Bisgaardia hudsonensis TaxID=109472 RepID=A0A4R2MWR7_9PAST|nr:peptidylprolyl isomerase [Bisgaardia hudsonensis]QLB13693.1 peptidylprolyl isomerase [Bisgaardia hudsonensis]TCP12027.1 periplasmic chaperone for outer membrane proteins SurA [Bisgaardia hudsonensis]
MNIFNGKKILFSVLGLFAIATTSQAIEKVSATVNGIPILESQVKKKLGLAANTKANYKVAVDKVIDEILVEQAIKDSKVKVDYAQIDRIIEGIAAQNGLTYGQFLDALDYQGINFNTYRNQIANQLIMSEVRNQAIGQGIDVSREEVQALGQKMLKEAKKQGTERKVSGTEYQVRHILLKLNPLLNDAQAKAKLTQIRNDIISKKITFADAALKYSKDYLSGANGGNLGFAFPETYVGEFAKTVARLKKGIISQPIKTEFGWHILEVTDTRQGDRTQEAYMQKAYEKLVNQQVELYSKDWVKALRKRANIQYLN